MAEALEVHGLVFHYQQYDDRPARKVLDGIDLTVHAGEKVLVLGPFDAGKTTFARIISGLTPRYLPGELSGTVRVCGKDLAETAPCDLVEDVGYVSQNPQEQCIASTVEDELAFPLESLGMERARMHALVGAALERWGLSRYAQVGEAQLSGGERKRVLLALETMLDPALWVLDESFDDLDGAWRDLLVRSIKETDHAVMVLASRYLAQFPGLFDRVFLLADGRLTGGDPATIERDFARVCGDDRLVPLSPPPVPSPVRRLEAAGLEVGHVRRDDPSHRSFSLAVDAFRLESGRIMTLSGPNGSGKSSFARVACGLDAPVSGSFSLDGRRADQRLLQRSVGYLFQNPDLQIFLPTVGDELGWSLERDRRVQKDRIASLIDETCRLFGLDRRETPTTMSYPKRKALQAAVYYLLDRPFYILDELDNALTYAKAQEIVRLLAGRGAGILVITHDPQFAPLVAHDGWSIEAGRLVKA